ncbi:VWA domain-containing protein [uncultured Tessaracoccus sp.]|uniref:vWA domain-containing protein n=1 Tax=uncultured Tessaracoccus sp. TaxID=905023 RepID=UPI0026215634|nr:VWA domain-containing protein [uncultured Tessaracoccus sp.]
MKQAVRRWSAGVLVALVALMSLPPGAWADEGQQAQQPVVVVTDFSGSMNEKDADSKGTTRIAAAKTAVKGLLAETPKDSRLGLVVYGARNDSCDDIQTLNKVGAFDAAALGKQVDGLQAKGNTPIGPALQHAAKELEGIEGPKAMVLVSDGEPNCEPPPACDVAKELAGQGIDLTVHTIGFKISGNAKAKETLRCIAEATGGSYTDVDDAGSLQEAMKQETLRALAGYQSQGIEVEGGPTAPDAEEIVAGQYVVKMPTGEQPRGENAVDNRRYFSVPFHEGWDVAVTATLVPPPIESGAEAQDKRQLRLTQVSPSGEAGGGQFDNQSQSGFLDESDLMTSVVLGGKPNYLNGDGEQHYFSVARSGVAWSDQEVDVEFTVGYVKSDAYETGEVADPGAEPGGEKPGEPTAVAGGNSFNNATMLKPGDVISDTINAGERRYFAIPVETGQNMRAVIDIPETESVETFGLAAYNPLRQKLQIAPKEIAQLQAGGSINTVNHRGGSLMDGSLKWPIVPKNIEAGSEQAAHAVGGVQYLVLGRSYDDESDKAALPFTLKTQVWGEESDQGLKVLTTPEEYKAEFGDPEADAEASASPSPSPSASEEPSKEPSEEPSEEESPKASDSEAAKDEEGGFPLVPVLGGVGGVLVLGGGVWLLIRRLS